MELKRVTHYKRLIDKIAIYVMTIEWVTHYWMCLTPTIELIRNWYGSPLMICNLMMVHSKNAVQFQDERGLFWVVFKDQEYTTHDLRPKTKSTMYLEPSIRSSHRYMKLLTTLRNIVVSKPWWPIGKCNVDQPNTITDEDVNKIADEFISLWSHHHPTIDAIELAHA